MNIGILQADSVLPQFRPTHGDYPDMIADVLGTAAAALDVSVSFETWDVEHGGYPPQMDACDGYVITGSRKSVYDDEPWIRRLLDYVRELHLARKKLVGLCFGHQLVAEALGGKTLGAEAGWGVGIHTSRLVARPWFIGGERRDREPAARETDSFSLIVSHRDQVVRLPEDAALVATSDFCPNSMFTLGEHILAMQGHPEFRTAYSKDLMAVGADILGPETLARGLASLGRPLMRDLVARWIIRFLLGREQAS